MATQTQSSSSSSGVSIDSSNPLYLHPSDHPSLLLVSKPFDGIGFGAWKRSMTIALSAKNKLSFVNGKLPRSAAASNSDIWQRCNDMVISWILNTLSREISGSVLYNDTAQQLWKDLNERFGQSNGAKLYQLQKNLSDISQGNDDVATYFTKLKSIWDELGNLNNLPTCTCGASQAIVKRDEVQCLFQFLMGLNSSYDSVRGTILLMKPLPSITQAYALLMQDEKQKEIHASTQFVAETAAMNVTTNFNTRSHTQKNVICTHCKKSGHTAAKCYRIIGFLKDFKFTRTKRMAANACVDTSDTEVASSHSNGLSPEQYSELLKLLQNNATISQNDEKSNTINFANFAGPFSEEASGSW